MQSCIKKEAMGDDPPYLAVGTEVSAKYKGAFCEAKVRKVVRSVKCKVTFKLGLGTAIVTDDQIRGTLRSGSSVEARHPEKKDFVEASITKIQDCSQYTVVFDDGDITTLRRSALCLKSGRHFAESETLDQLPLTHPEHFSTPVIGGSRRGRRSRQTHDDGSDDEEDASTRKGKKKEEKEVDIGKVVCVELGERKKQKDNWFPGLVVAPTAQDTVRIRVKEEYLVRSFKDGRYYTVPKKEATEFTREIGAKVDNNTLKTAVEKALQFLDRDELPPHWDRELLFGMDGSSGDSDSDAGSDSDSSDDEPREEKDHFVAQLYKFMDDRGTPINKGPTIGMKDVDLYKLFKVVHKIGGYNRVTNHNQWKMVSQKLGFGQNNSSNTNHVKQAYKKFLHSFEDFYRKLGCTMVNHPRGSRSRHRSSRSLIRDRDRATPINTPKRKEGEEKPSTAIATKKVEKEETTKVEEDKKKEEVQKEEKKEDKKVEEKKAEKKPDKKVEEKKEEKKGDGKKEDKKEEAEKVGGRVVRERESSKALEETKTKESTAPKKETKSKAKEFEGKTRDSVGKAKAKEEAAKVKEKAEKAAAAAAASTAPEPKVKEEKEEKPIKVEETTTPKTRAKDDSSEKKNSVVEEPTIPSSVKVEPSDNVVKSPTSSVVASKAPETLKVEPVEVTSPVLSVEVRKGRELGLRSQVKDLPSMEVTPKDVKLAEKDKSRGLEDVRDMMHEDLKMRMEEEDEVDDDEDDEEEDDDGRKDSSSVTGEESKREERRREREKRGEDEEKLTRSKSKESNPERKTRESRTPVRESESKKGPSKMGSGMGVVGSANAKRPVSSSSSSASSGSGGASAEEERKRGRKRKDLDEKSSKSEEHLGQLSNHIHVGVGDKLKVYYGPTHESKVTYEAKVIDTEIDGHQTLYLVHYTGWNNRYDEWIKRSRIAENLSWTPTRAKRLRQQQQSQSMKPMGKRGRPSLSGGTSRTSVDGGNGGPPGSQQQMGAQTRSTTPSGSSQSPSVRGAGSSGASPSPSTPTSAGMRGVTTRGNSGMASADYSPVSSFSIEMRRRSRRMSGHTDLSMMSESESEEYESEPEIEPLRTRSRGERKTSISITPSKEEMTPTEEKPSKELKGGDSRLLRKRGKRKKEKVDEEEDDKKDAEELSDNLDGSITACGMEGQEQPQQSEMAEDLGTSPGEKKRTKRTTRRSARDESERLLDNLNVDMTPMDMEDDMPKGRDFDLNQIRSELKGIEKAVKLPIDLPSMQSESGEAMDVSEDNPSQEEDVDSKESDIKEPPILVLEASVPVAEEVAEDIYEFKEPEPFEFEVRSKRDSLNLEDRGMKLGRRCQSRLMNRREMKTSPKNSESKEAMGSWGGESISSFRASSGRRNASKKSEDTTPTDEAVAKSLSPSRSDLKSGDSEASHSSSKVPSSSSSSCESSASKVHPTPGSDDDDAPLTLPSKHSSLPDEEEHPKKAVPSSGSVAKNRSSPFGRISSSTSMFSPRKSPSLNSPSAASPPSIHSIDLEPLCLFRDLPSSADGDVGEEDDGGDESEDRLIISDDPGEVEAPLFTYPQRHEELFPASLVSSAGVGSSCDDTEETRKRTDDEPPCLVPMSLFELQGKSGEKGDKEGHPGIERSEVVKVVVQKEEDGAEMEAVIVKKPQTTKCSDSFNDDVIKLLLKDEEEEEGEGEGDESINAAIQRAISSDIMDEDDDDDESLTLFGKKSAKEFFRQSGKDKETASPVDKKDEGRSKAPPPPPKNSTVEEVIEKKEVEAVETAKSKSPEPQVSTTKPSSTPSREESVSVVVREYDSPTDIDSDSSEESRLVIDKLDEGGDDYSVTSIESDTERETKEDSSAVDSVVIADSAKVEHEKKCTAKPDVIGGRDEPKVEEESAKDAESDKQTVPVVAPVEKEESEPVMKPSVEKANPKEEKEVNEWKLESAKEAECTKGQTENQAKFDEEADSSLRSLLCEETIPGSPVPPANDPRESCTELPEKQSKVPEMPFASVPGSENCTSTNLLRSDNVRNDNAMCGGGSSSSLTPGAPILKGSLEAFPSESSVATPQCCPPAPSGNETNASENESGKDAGGNDAAPVMDNTPPTTPESSLSTLSGSPREERGGSSPGLDNDSSKSHRESSEIDLDSPVEGNKDHFSEDSLLNIEVSNSEDNNQLILLQGLKVSSAQKRPGGQDSEKDSSVAIGAASAGAQDSPSKKKRRTHRRNEESVQGTKRLRHGAGRGRNMGGSDSDDTSENSTSGGCTPLASTESVVSSRSPRPSKYNFYVELDPELDGTQRIALLQQKLQELRKTYMSVKAELACIDRRRKKLRRREREEKAAKHEVACS